MKKYTITSMFFVPTLGISADGLETNGFIDAYCKDIGTDIQYENAVYLLFRPKNIDKFRDFVEFERQRRNSTFIEDYDYEGGYTVLVYGLKTEFLKDFDLIRKSKYSKTSKEFQALFPETKTIIKDKKPVKDTSLQHKVFNKDKRLIKYWEDRIGITFKSDMELWEGYDENMEMLDINKIREKELV